MYAAAVSEGKTRVEANASPRMVNAWLERSAEQLWIDLLAPTHEQLAFIRDRFGLHALAIEECDHSGVRPKLEEFEDHLYLVFHGINHNEGEDLLEAVEFKVFLWRDRLITVHNRPSTSIRAVQEHLRQTPQFFARGGVDTILHRIMDTVVDHYFPVLEAMEDESERLEDAILSDCRPVLAEQMLRLRRRSFALQRMIQLQSDLLGGLVSGRVAAIGSERIPYFRDVADHLLRMQDRAHGVRELLAVAMECYLSQSSNRMNALMMRLTVLATLLLPISCVAGLMGMNLNPLPLHVSPGAFWLTCLLGLAIGALLLVLLHRIRTP
jgi:magnesium transporter